MGIITQIIVYFLLIVGGGFVLLVTGLAGLSIFLTGCFTEDFWTTIVGLALGLIALLVTIVLILNLVGVSI